MKYLSLLAALLLAAPLSPKSPLIEKRIKIAVVDTGLYMSKEIEPYVCLDGHRDFTRTDLQDRFGHGTNVAHLIAKSLDPVKHCLVIVKWLDPSTPAIATNFTLQAAIYYAAHSDVSYINVSAGGGYRMKKEEKAIKFALDRGARVVVAAGNDGYDLSAGCIYYPACYPFKHDNFYVVGALDERGIKVYFSNFGGPVNAWAPGVEQSWKTEIIMSGTSQATGIYTGMLVERESKKR